MRIFTYTLPFVMIGIVGCSATGKVEANQEKETATEKNKKFYINTAVRENWNGALTACIKNNSQLASIDNEKELEEVRRVICQTEKKARKFWLSGSDQGSEGDFYWVTGGTRITIPWGKGQPSNSGPGEHCVELWDGTYRLYRKKTNCERVFSLNDDKCDVEAYFVCQYFE